MEMPRKPQRPLIPIEAKVEYRQDCRENKKAVIIGIDDCPCIDPTAAIVRIASHVGINVANTAATLATRAASLRSMF